MKPEPGAPAFENIDELLTDKIVSHGRDHVDTSQTPPSDDEISQSDIAAGKQPDDKSGHVFGVPSVLLILAIGTAGLFIYRLLRRHLFR